MISVDTKKRSWSAGTKRRPGVGAQGEPVQVNTHDFLDRQAGKAIPYGIPYGIYDTAANTGWVTVGTDHDTAATPPRHRRDTAAFAVASIRRWWQAQGQAQGQTSYPRPPGC